MRALTVCQPYAELIASGVKLVENRTWTTKYRGRLYIHAGRSREWLTSTMVDGVEYERYTGKMIEQLTFGAVIAIATLIEVLPIDEIRAGRHDARFPWLRTHEHAEGPFCWIFAESITRIGPWRYKGKQGLFDIAADELDRIANHQLGTKEPCV